MISNQNKMDKVLSYKNPMYDLSYLFSICNENEPSENYILSKINYIKLILIKYME